MGTFTIFFVLCWSVGLLISLAGEMTFPGANEAGLVSGVMRIDFAQYTNLGSMIWGGLKLIGEVLVMLVRMITWDFIFLTGNWVYLRYLLASISIGYIIDLLSTFFGRR